MTPDEGERLFRCLIHWVLILAVLAGLFWGGSQPFARHLIAVPWDKAVHALVFAALTLLLARASGWPLWCVGLVATLAGGADEIRQSWLPGRSADWVDWGADLVGIGVALGLAGWFARRAAGRG